MDPLYTLSNKYIRIPPHQRPMVWTLDSRLRKWHGPFFHAHWYLYMCYVPPTEKGPHNRPHQNQMEAHNQDPWGLLGPSTLGAAASDQTERSGLPFFIGGGAGSAMLDRWATSLGLEISYRQSWLVYEDYSRSHNGIPIWNFEPHVHPIHGRTITMFSAAHVIWQGRPPKNACGPGFIGEVETEQVLDSGFKNGCNKGSSKRQGSMDTTESQSSLFRES